MKSLAGTELPRTRREAWVRHVHDFRKWAEERNWPCGRVEWQLERDRFNYEAGIWPWSQYPEEGRPSDDEIKGAIASHIAESGDQRIGERRLWPLIQRDFPGCYIPRKTVRDLLKEIRGGACNVTASPVG